MSEWQPIETAPKDVALLLHYQSLGVVYGCYDSYGTADWWIIRTGDDAWWSPYMKDEESPLRWAPIPEPPTDANVVSIKPISRAP